MRCVRSSGVFSVRINLSQHPFLLLSFFHNNISYTIWKWEGRGIFSNSRAVGKIFIWTISFKPTDVAARVFGHTCCRTGECVRCYYAFLFVFCVSSSSGHSKGNSAATQNPFYSTMYRLQPHGSLEPEHWLTESLLSKLTWLGRCRDPLLSRISWLL